MTRCTLALAALAVTFALNATPVDGGATKVEAPPPVLRRSEPSDSVLVTLPGPRVKRVTPKPTPPAAAVIPAAPVLPPKSDAPSGPVASATLKQPSASEDPRPLLRRAPKPIFPVDFQKDSAVFCQQRIAQWTMPDASNLLGEPLRERPAYSDDKAENGRIYAFSDPTGRYRALELDFADSGLLRTVFVYPWSMTWLECRRLWGARVATSGANDGRTFYSYMNRHLDVLVDPAGKVVSLGFY